MLEYCDVNDLTHFWRAWRYHPAGRSFPVLMRHMLELTLNFTFHQCHLARDWRLEPGTHCVHPRCQCAGQTVPERAIKVTLKLNERRGRRAIAVPEWMVRNKVHVKVEPLGDLVARVQDLGFGVKGSSLKHRTKCPKLHHHNFNPLNGAAVIYKGMRASEKGIVLPCPALNPKP